MRARKMDHKEQKTEAWALFCVLLYVVYVLPSVGEGLKEE